MYELMGRLAYASEDDEWINQSTVKYFTAVYNASFSTRALGWDTNINLSSTCGDQFSRLTFLHTGYTGTQVCVDPEASDGGGLITILLTNRCHPNDSAESSSGISRIRREFNTAVMNAYRNPINF